MARLSDLLAIAVLVTISIAHSAFGDASAPVKGAEGVHSAANTEQWAAACKERLRGALVSARSIDARFADSVPVVEAMESDGMTVVHVVLPRVKGAETAFRYHVSVPDVPVRRVRLEAKASYLERALRVGKSPKLADFPWTETHISAIGPLSNNFDGERLAAHLCLFNFSEATLRAIVDAFESAIDFCIANRPAYREHTHER